MQHNRLLKGAGDNNIIPDEQNGFYSEKKNTIDHLSSLTNIVESGIRNKLSTLCAFIDFRKAYDLIVRNF